MPGQIKTIYSDSNKQNAVLPRTKVSAITDSEGNSLQSLLDNKQDTLVSGTNIKTINNESLLGSGNITVQGGVQEVFVATENVTTRQELREAAEADKVIYVKLNGTNGYLLATKVSLPSQTNYVSIECFANISRNLMTDPYIAISYYFLVTDTGWTRTVMKTTYPSQATDSDLGLVKLNSSESVTLNSNGQLDIGGRLGQFPSTTGVYSPKSISPATVKNGSFLLTEASGTSLGAKSLAVSTGTNITLKQNASAGTTQYVVSNTYANRIICAGAVGGTIALNESTAATNYVNVVSVQINGSNYVPDSSANSSTNNIVITTDASINPNSSTSSIRLYSNEGKGGGFSNLFVGQGVGGEGGASIVVGQKVYSASGNACALVGADIYNAGNGSAIFGRQHINRKNRVFLAGTGHDTTNARSESVSALGEWSDLSSTETLFAIGDGTDHTARSNAFEVRDQCIVLKSPNGTKWKIMIDNTGNLTTTAI